MQAGAPEVSDCEDCAGRGWYPVLRANGQIEAMRCDCPAGAGAELPADLGKADEETTRLVAELLAKLARAGGR